MDTTAASHPRNDLALAEAALFLAPQPLTRRALAKILGGVAQAYVDQLLADLKEQFADSSRGIELHIEDGRAMFRVKPAYVNEVAHLAPQHDIPRQELRTLAVIAYNHPMTQSNLIKIRGNKGYQHVQELIERNLVSSEPHGRTRLLRVTREFLRHFGLSTVEEFRFHFPTLAEENAEELARGAGSDDAEDDIMSKEVGRTSATESSDSAETQDTAPVEPADEEDDARLNVDPSPTTANEQAGVPSDDEEDAPTEALSEEVEDG